MNKKISIKKSGDLGTDIWVQCFIDNKLTRKILFSLASQEELHSVDYDNVLLKVEKKLDREPYGPNLKITPMINKNEKGSTIEWHYTEMG